MGRERGLAVPPKLAKRSTLCRQTSASRVTLGKRSELHGSISVHSDSSGGNFGRVVPGGGFSQAPRLSGGFCQPTFLRQCF